MTVRRQERRPGYSRLVLILIFLSFTLLLSLNFNRISISTIKVSRTTQITVGNYSAADKAETSETSKLEDTSGLQWVTDVAPFFFVYDLAEERNNASSLQEECKASFFSSFCATVFSTKERTESKSEAQVFLVPVFDVWKTKLRELKLRLRLLRQDRFFLKFRGSDFIFVCYSTSCDEIEELILDVLGVANRSILISRNHTIEWTCQNRNIKARDYLSTSVFPFQSGEEAHLLSLALERSGVLTKERKRWNCEGRSFWGIEDHTIFDFGTVRDTSFKSRNYLVAYCGIPKVGSSVAVLLMRRMNGMPDWKQANTLAIRNFSTGYKWRYKDKDSAVWMYDHTQWVKGMLVRDPISRLLSGYRSKIETLKEFYRIPGGWHHSAPPTFEEFVHKIVKKKAHGNMDWMDRHIRPQSALCGARTLPYDFIGHYEDRERDMHDFLVSLGLWEKLGASGWGANGNASIFSEDEQIVRKKKLKPVTHADTKETIRKYYTKQLVRIVMDLYHEDFVRFGFSMNIDDYL